VLSTSGHIAALVNPPGNPKASYHTNEDSTPDAKAWLKGAESHQGTWWDDIDGWLDARCGDRLPAPKELGSLRYPVLADAPGTYVLDR
jgi:polyhydroxyalkanoate synthase